MSTPLTDHSKAIKAACAKMRTAWEAHENRERDPYIIFLMDDDAVAKITAEITELREI